MEAAEQTVAIDKFVPTWRKPSFVGEDKSGTAYGNAVHTLMRYIRMSQCSDISGVEEEIRRLVAEKCISEREARIISAQKVADFFKSEIGTQLRNHPNVIREFKFSILDDGNHYGENLHQEKVLLQGVVDCAIVEEDGITILDFKTDYVTEDTISEVMERYRLQIETYAEAMARIYEMPVKYVNRLMEHSWGQKVIRFYDPDGNLIEVGTPM